MGYRYIIIIIRQVGARKRERKQKAKDGEQTRSKTEAVESQERVAKSQAEGIQSHPETWQRAVPICQAKVLSHESFGGTVGIHMEGGSHGESS